MTTTANYSNRRRRWRTPKLSIAAAAAKKKTPNDKAVNVEIYTV